MVRAEKFRARMLGRQIWQESPMDVKAYPKGQHGPQMGARRRSLYGKQLAEKQYIRYHYGLEEQAMLQVMKRAKKMKGSIIDNMAIILESRLATVVYRSGIAPTIFAAGQMVSHGKILVNGQKISCRGYQVKIGDVVSVHESYHNNPILLETLKKNTSIPDYLSKNDTSVSLVRAPGFREIPFPYKGLDTNLIVSFYSKRI